MVDPVERDGTLALRLGARNSDRRLSPPGDSGAATPSAAPLPLSEAAPSSGVERDNRAVEAAAKRIGLGLVMACLAATLAVGVSLKAHCAGGDWTDGRQYRTYCYSDIVPLLVSEQLGGNRLPYLNPCVAPAGECDEYPVLSMYSMRLAAWMSNGTAGYFYANVLLLAIAAFVVVICLYLIVGSRALYFGLAPTLLLYGFMNWDLIAVAFATAATLAYVNRRNVWSGALLGLGAAAKAFPALLLVPFVLGRFKEREPDKGIHLAWAAAGAWLAVNLPFIISSPRSWWEFFRFNGKRPADWDSLWFIACNRITGNLYCGHTLAINVASGLLFVGASILLYRLRRRIVPDFPRWTAGFAILVAFLLTNKVYSPQYGLWLLPWFALVLPDLRLFVAFEIADVAVFLTRFSWFGRFSGIGGWPIGAFEIAVIVRAVILLWCVVAWVRSREVEPAPLPPEPALADVPA